MKYSQAISIFPQNTNEINRDTKRAFKALSRTEQEQTVLALRKATREKIRNVNKATTVSPAVASIERRGGVERGSVKNKSSEDLWKEARKYGFFNRSKTSTVKGSKEWLHNMSEATNQRGFETNDPQVNEKFFGVLQDFKDLGVYDRLVNAVGSHEAVSLIYQAVESGYTDVEQLAYMFEEEVGISLDGINFDSLYNNDMDLWDFA